MLSLQDVTNILETEPLQEETKQCQKFYTYIEMKCFFSHQRVNLVYAD